MQFGSVVVCSLGAVAATAVAQRSTPVQVVHPSGSASDLMGNSIAIDGDTMVVGVSNDDVIATDQGSALVYRWTGSGWAYEATLTAIGAAAADYFGTSVAISGDTIVVGAYADDVGAVVDQGSAYVFIRSGTTWTQQARLTAADGAAGDNFGFSVTISGNTAVIGANYDDVGSNTDQGSAYVFTRSGNIWSQQAQLVATGGSAGDHFGSCAVISENTVAIGASTDDVGSNTDQGSVFIFTQSGTTWSQQAKLTVAGGSSFDYFGHDIALSGDTLLATSAWDDVGSNTDQGSVTIFTRSGTIWSQQIQLFAAGGAAGDSFGRSVAISGDTAIVGAPYDDVGTNTDQGSASIFDVAFNDFSVAHNDVTDLSYPTLAAALLPAVSGQQITATEAAWRTTGSINTLGRSLSQIGRAHV